MYKWKDETRKNTLSEVSQTQNDENDMYLIIIEPQL